MGARSCPKCGSRSLRYRRKKSDYACTRCDFQGDLPDIDEDNDADDDELLDGPDWQPPTIAAKAYLVDRRVCLRCEAKQLRHRARSNDYRCAACAAIVPDQYFVLAEKRNALTHEVVQLAYGLVVRHKPPSTDGYYQVGVFLGLGPGYLAWSLTRDWGGVAHWSVSIVTVLLAGGILGGVLGSLFAKKTKEPSAELTKVLEDEDGLRGLAELARAESESEVKSALASWWSTGAPIDLSDLASAAKTNADDPASVPLMKQFVALVGVLKEMEQCVPDQVEADSASSDSGEESETAEQA